MSPGPTHAPKPHYHTSDSIVAMGPGCAQQHGARNRRMQNVLRVANLGSLRQFNECEVLENAGEVFVGAADRVGTKEDDKFRERRDKRELL